MATKNVTKSNKSLDSNETMTAILSYLGILVLIPLFAIKSKKRNEFIKFHLQQGLNLFIVEIILVIIFSILSAITFVFGILGNILYVLIVVVSIIAIIKALNKESWKIPVIENLKIIKL